MPPVTQNRSVLKINLATILLFAACFLFSLGCMGKNKIKMQKRLMNMTDTELIDHYKMIEMRTIDIDRTAEQAVAQDIEFYGGHYPEEYYNHLGHLFDRSSHAILYT